MNEPKKKGMCAYCGKYGPLTRDHIPPISFFPKPRPSNLITVPCCEVCRAGWSDDDEYFRTAVVSSAEVSEHKHARKVNESVLRALRKPSKQGFAKLIRDSLQLIEVTTDSGIYLGKAGVLAIEKWRFDRVAERIIRGLFFHEKGRPVPNKYEVTNRLSQGQAKQILDGIPEAKFIEPRVIGDYIFAYTYAPTVEDPDSMVWLSYFYKRLLFVGFTVKPKELR